MGFGGSALTVAEMMRPMMETNKKGAVHVPPGEGKMLWVAEELMTFVISGEDTGGKYALTDSTVPPQGEVPPHIHHREDEAFWVLEEELEVVVGEDKIGASAGSFVHLPRGVIHTYKNVGATPAWFSTLIVPAGLEKIFEERWASR
jgi:quercetin dioxygenase-like cupin family protein